MVVLEGLPFVLGQLAGVLVIIAVLAAGGGWFLGRGSRRRSEELLERAIAAFTESRLESAAFAPSPSQIDTIRTADGHLGTTDSPDVAAQAASHLPFGVAPINHVPLDDDDGDEVDVTVLRPAPEPTVVLSGPDATVIRSAPQTTVIRPSPAPVVQPSPDATIIRRAPHASPTSGPGSTVIRSAPGRSPQAADAQPASPGEAVPALPVDDRDLAIGRIEAAALAAWDRTVPLLTQQIQDLADQNDALRHLLREAEERSVTDASAQHNTVLADHDNKVTELRARA